VNALIAKAVEICAEKGIEYFNYGCFEYAGKKENTLTDFKARHGFVRIDVPIYYVPLTLKGRVYLALGMHRQLKALIPPSLLKTLIKARAEWYARVLLPIRRALSRGPSAGLHGKVQG
jgi:hypothetical protein